MTERSLHPSNLTASWRDNAAGWTRAVRTRAIESRRLATDAAILAAVAAAQPRHVLDLGCGEGWLTRALGEMEIQAVGVDGSGPLIQAATALGGGLYLELSYGELTAEPEAAGRDFDCVVANFALLEEDLGPLLRALHRIMTPTGQLIIQTLHPLAAGGAYADGWRVEDFRGFPGPENGHTWTPMPWYFRTLGSWIELLRATGFQLHRLSEPGHPQTGQPLSLLMVARRDLSLSNEGVQP